MSPEQILPEGSSEKEGSEKLRELFAGAETVFTAEGRESAKLLLPKIYSDFMALNKRWVRDDYDWQTVWSWNSDGDLTEEEFNALNLRRKLLSSAIGIMTASGEIRHDLNPI